MTLLDLSLSRILSSLLYLLIAIQIDDCLLIEEVTRLADGYLDGLDHARLKLHLFFKFGGTFMDQIEKGVTFIALFENGLLPVCDLHFE